MIRVMLVDDQELLRSGFRLILETTDDIRVVGERRTAVPVRRPRADCGPTSC